VRRPYVHTVGIPGPKVPSPTLADVGKGRFARLRRTAVLERHDGSAWHEVGRFGSVRDAGVALDEAIGAGAASDTLRVVETEPSTASRVFMIVGALAAAIAFAFVLYVLLG
jgi:hypothetical protein